MSISVICDKDLIDEVGIYDVIAVGANPYCMLYGGFASKLRFMFPEIQEMDDKTGYGDLRKIGTRKTWYGKPIISLLYYCNYPRKDKVFVDYDALRNCFATLNSEFKGMKIASTMPGMTRFNGNGDKDICMRIVEEECKDIDLYLYDYKQLSRREEIAVIYKRIKSLVKKDKKKAVFMMKNYDELLKKAHLR